MNGAEHVKAREVVEVACPGCGRKFPIDPAVETSGWCECSMDFELVDVEGEPSIRWTADHRIVNPWVTVAAVTLPLDPDRYLQPDEEA